MLYKYLFVLFYLSIVLCKNKSITFNRFQDADVRGEDSIRVTQCDIKCNDHTSRHKLTCHKKCRQDDITKPGSCPYDFTNVTVFVQACIKSCNNDKDCFGIDKCCVHSCGKTCQPATDLIDSNKLPLVPTNITVVEERRGKSVVQISWNVHQQQQQHGSDQSVLYLVEERHQTGRTFNIHRHGMWSPILNTKQTNVVMTNVLQPGRWYQFKVAAVNVIGTKGYSVPSKPFSLTLGPSKPGKPRKLRVINVQKINNTVWGEIRWNPGRSDLPIQNYKVFWSLRLNETRPSNISGSVYMRRHVVPKDRRKHQLKGLELNTLYFIQVHAISSYGRVRLKGDKAAMIFNTSVIADQSSSHQHNT